MILCSTEWDDARHNACSIGRMIHMPPLLPCRLLVLISLLEICLAFFTSSVEVRSASSEHHCDHRHRFTNNKNDDIVGRQRRDYCSKCQRPIPQCLCNILPREKIILETQLLILQHPAEFRRATISTVPLLKSVLENCQVLVGRSFHTEEVERIIDDAACKHGKIPLLLFPGPNAITLDDEAKINSINPLQPSASASATTSSSAVDKEGTTSCPPESSSSSSRKYLLIAVDGTWTQAKRMLRNSPVLLERCQPVQFIGTNVTSIYDNIRKQPDSYCLSTLESCERAMKLLEPNNPNMIRASYYLLEALRSMILTQMKYERMHLEQYPDSIRNMEKLMAKKQRQVQLVVQERTSRTSRHTMNATTLPNGYTIRPLVESDGTYVDSRWPFRSSKSLVMIEKQILGDNMNATIYGCSTCLGIEFDNSRLVGCIMRHRNGSIGILHVDEEHRRFGLGQALLKEATEALARRNEDVFAFILDGNNASEALFTKLGWEKDIDASSAKGTGWGGCMFNI